MIIDAPNQIKRDAQIFSPEGYTIPPLDTDKDTLPKLFVDTSKKY
ncbi:MAG TPA: hypothetical protein PLZ51_13005 [Aggregatilineales bacterium]|nr:hypothetical protein [Aggregatilineales bacterium]